MFLVKVLERKGVIQLFGAALILSPFVNTLVKMSTLTEIPDHWSVKMFWKIIMAGSVPNQILYVATLIIGALMLQGKSSVWKFALMLLGGYILLQISDFGHVRTSKVTWLFFITNVMVFLFIADQLVWKVKVSKPMPVKNAAAGNTGTPKPHQQQKSPSSASMAAAPPPPPRPAPRIHKKILLQFSGMGPWAQLIGISPKGIHVRSLSEPPSDIASREIEILLKNGSSLRTRLVRQTNHDYYFNYISLTTEDIKSLNEWLYSLSQAA